LHRETFPPNQFRQDVTRFLETEAPSVTINTIIRMMTKKKIVLIGYRQDTLTEVIYILLLVATLPLGLLLGSNIAIIAIIRDTILPLFEMELITKNDLTYQVIAEYIFENEMTVIK
jgi:hypothetical protein